MRSSRMIVKSSTLQRRGFRDGTDGFVDIRADFACLSGGAFVKGYRTFGL